MDAMEQIFQILKFPVTFSFVIIPRMVWRNLTKIGQIYRPYKFALSGYIPTKFKCEILAHKGLQTTRVTLDYLASKNRCKQNMEISSSLNMSGCREDFPQGIRPGSRLWHLPDLLTFIWKYVFLNNSVAFKDFRKFLNGNVSLNVWIQFSQIKQKSIFSASEVGK